LKGDGREGQDKKDSIQGFIEPLKSIAGKKAICKGCFGKHWKD